jgi:uncharacterized protein (DUF2126 family)
MDDSAAYLELLAAIGEAAHAAGLTGLTLGGYPPPVDRRVQWSSLTPDPAVIEANLPPTPDLAEFYAVNRALFAAADREGLAPFRLHYNGRETDSGGGGQLTVGGPTAEGSPFFVEPQLLPRLIRYFNRHPSLSYWFAPDYVGSGSQAPRPDEGLRDRFQELQVALEQMAQRTFPDPEFIWGSLAPFLADAVGNSHRSELNIEKLWNPHFGDRGRAGLVELRPFRMAADAPRFTALAALARALVARLMQGPFEAPLIDWGDRLHGRFALPYFLARDLAGVLADLEAAGLGVGGRVAALLRDEGPWEIGSYDWNGAQVRISRALEFWPLVGDLAAQQPADSRLVDASTSRVEFRLTAPAGIAPDHWSLCVDGRQVPLGLPDDEDTTLVVGIRYRSFVPRLGLHPAMAARERLDLVLRHLPSGRALRIGLHEWQPEGGAYPGLPPDRAEARRRRRERVVVADLPPGDPGPCIPPPPEAVGDYCLDLRRL